jgi:bifunctional pyridoxal-dependent enzyme with beta-cystathionase and maltose regulon repressor activities
VILFFLVAAVATYLIWLDLKPDEQPTNNPRRVQ